MTIDFYYSPVSAPCRAILMTAKAIGVDLNLKIMDLQAGQHLTPEYIKMNPQHTIPLLVDNGFCLAESRAIMVYLIEKYGKTDNPLYPRDTQKRALINQRLFFDMGTLYTSFAEYYYPVLFFGATEFNAENYKKIEQAVGFLNTFLEGSTYVTGETFTVADITLVATLSTFAHTDGFQLNKSYPNVTRWFNKCKVVTPRYDLNVAGLQQFKKLFEVAKKIK